MGVSIGSIFGTLDLDDRATGKFTKFIKSFDGAAGKIAAAGTVMSGFSAGITALAVGAVKAAGAFEQTKIGFTTMLGSAEKANAFLQEMQDFAAKTPFEFPDLIEGSRRLLAMGFSAQQVKPMLTAVGDAAAGLGVGAEGIQRITLALGQMQAKGKVSAQEMNQLAEAGINAWQFLADKMGTTVAEVQAKSERGMLDAASSISTIVEGMGKKFGGMMEAQSKTFLGQISTLKDEFGFIMRDFGTALMPVAQAGLQALQALLPVVRSVGKAFAEAGPVTKGFVVSVVAIGAALGPGLLAFAGLVKTITFVSSALSVAKAAMFAFGNTVPVLTARLTVMNAVATVTSTLLGKIAIVGAAAFVGWQIGKAIDEMFGLSTMIGEAIAGIENLRRLEKGTGSVAAMKVGIDPTQFQTMDKWAAAIKKVNEENSKLRGSSEGVAGGVKKVTAATDGQIRSMMQAAKNADIMKKAKEILGREAVNLGEALRVSKIADSMDDIGNAAETSATRIKALKDEFASLAKAKEILFQAGNLPGQKAQDQLFGILADPQIATHISKSSMEAATAMRNLAEAKEILFKAGNLPGQNAQDPFAGIVGPGLATSLSATTMKGMGASAGISLGKSLRDSFKGALTDLPNVIMAALQGGGNVGKAVGGLFGTSIGQVLGEGIAKSIGGTLGKTLGSVIPGIGTLLGSLAGGAIGKLVGGLFGGEEKKVNDLRDAFLAANGGFLKLQQTLAFTGQDLVKRVFDAKTVKDFEQAVRDVNSALALQGQAQQDLDAAIQKYGFSIEELGPKFAQQKLDEQAIQLFKEFELLRTATGNIPLVIEKMGPALVDFVNTARTAGASIPEALRPMVEELIKSGQLLDENGVAFGSAEEAGITFAQSIEESMMKAVEQIERLVNALLGINNVPVPGIKIPVEFQPGNVGNKLPSDAIEFGTGALVTKPTLGVVGDRGPEVIAPFQEFKDALAEGGGNQTIHVVGQVGERVLLEFIAEAVRDNKHGIGTRLGGR